MVPSKQALCNNVGKTTPQDPGFNLSTLSECPICRFSFSKNFYEAACHLLTRHFGQEINKLLGVSADQPIIQVIGVFIPKKFEHLRIYLLFSKVHISVLRESYRPYSNTIQNIFVVNQNTNADQVCGLTICNEGPA